MSHSKVATQPGETPAALLPGAETIWEHFHGPLDHLRRLPHHWKLTYEQGAYRSYRLNGSSGLTVELWLYEASDDRPWLKVRVSQPSRTPDWGMVLQVSRLFVGRRPGYIVVAPLPEVRSIRPHRITIYVNLLSTSRELDLPIEAKRPLGEWLDGNSPGGPQSEWDWNAQHSDPDWP